MKCKRFISAVIALCCMVNIMPVNVNAAAVKTDTSKKYSDVGTVVTSAKRTADNIVKLKIKVNLPKGKSLKVISKVVKKPSAKKVYLSNKVVVHFAESKGKLKSLPVIKSVKVSKVKDNTMELTLKSGDMPLMEKVYVSVRFKKNSKFGTQASNFSAFKKVSNAKGYSWVFNTYDEGDNISDGPVDDSGGKGDQVKTLYRITCNTCHKSWEGYNGYDELLEKFDEHNNTAYDNKWKELGLPLNADGTPNYSAMIPMSVRQQLDDAGSHMGYTNYCATVTVK